MILVEAIHDSALALEGFQAGLSSLSKVVMDERIALDFLLKGQGGFCMILSTFGYAWINNALGRVGELGNFINARGWRHLWAWPLPALRWAR